MLRILICGAGTAGLALAGFLRRRGLEPALIDKAAAWGAAGYGISLWSAGLDVLDALGLRAEALQRADRVEEWIFRGPDGAIRRRARVSPGGETPLVSIHRAELHSLLRGPLPPACVRLGVSIAEIEERSSGVRVRLTDGAEEEYDAVLGADGVRSRVRELAFENWTLRYGGTQSWSFWTPPDFPAPPGFNELLGEDGKTFLLAPVGGRTMASVAAPAARPAPEIDPRAALRQAARPDDWLLPELARRLDEVAELYHGWNYQVRTRRWTRGRIALLGDAAHALHPVSGMGASLALEDAQALAEELAGCRPADVPAALARYEARRKPRVRPLQIAASVARRAYFPSSRAMAGVRNFAVWRTPLVEALFSRQARAARA